MTVTMKVVLSMQVQPSPAMPEQAGRVSQPVPLSVKQAALYGQG
jgi:hypothetical protein